MRTTRRASTRFHGDRATSRSPCSGSAAHIPGQHTSAKDAVPHTTTGTAHDGTGATCEATPIGPRPRKTRSKSFPSLRSHCV
eukprot:1909360-Prymnesium_polylepis.1